MLGRPTFEGFKAEDRQELLRCFAAGTAETLVAEMEDRFVEVFGGKERSFRPAQRLRFSLQRAVKILRDRRPIAAPDIPPDVRSDLCFLLEKLMALYLPAPAPGRPKGVPRWRAIVEGIFLGAIRGHRVGTGSQRSARAFAITLNAVLSPKRRVSEDSAKRALAKAVKRERVADARERSPEAQARGRAFMEALRREGWLG